MVEQCAAIVAEDGGVLSHTAIIAREFGKPCILGVSGCTDLIQDGDFIEVNADLGLVRRVK